jgi:hypothetical protein
MAANKNQHYVPQCYLKRFSNTSSLASICLYNIDGMKLIPQAPIKKQCSQDYFYGEDLKLEKALQPFEGKYSNLVRQIASQGYFLNEKDKSFLLDFWLLQHLRTEAASKRLVEMSEGIVEVAGIEDYKFQIKDAVQQSMKSFFDTRHHINDLKLCLLRNKTPKVFYTSDDPAILTNHWYFHDARAKFQSFGIASAGVLLLLPLTPYIMMIAYDPNVYNMAESRGWVNIKNKSDIDAFNLFQLINCHSNIYLNNSNDEENLYRLYQKIKAIRPTVKHKFNYAVFDTSDGNYTRYKAIPKSEVLERQEDTLIHYQPIQVSPPEWPSQILWRKKGFVYTNDTGVGYVRSPYSTPSSIKPFYKILSGM